MSDILGRSARSALGEIRQCTATNRAGERCKRFAAPGAFVCYSHGANAPQVRRRAEQRLLSLVDKAIEVINGHLESRPPCPTCGRTDSDRDPVALRAAQMALIHAGFGPTVNVKQTPAEDQEFVYFLSDEQLAQMSIWIDEAEQKAKVAAAMATEREPLFLPDIAVRPESVELVPTTKQEEE